MHAFWLMRVSRAESLRQRKSSRFISLCIGDKNMKRTLTLLGLSLMMSAPLALAQKPMDQANEKAVKITQGPNISNISGNSATINWTTNSSGANRVRYRVAGSNSEW